MGPLYKKRPNQLIHFTPQSYYYIPLPCPPCEVPLSCEIRNLHPVHPTMSCSEISTLLSTSRRSNIFCAPRRNAALAIYFYAVISTSSGHQWSPAPTIYIYFYAAISTSSGRHGTAIVLRSPGVARALKFFSVFFCFCFVSFSRSSSNKY